MTSEKSPYFSSTGGTKLRPEGLKLYEHWPQSMSLLVAGDDCATVAVGSTNESSTHSHENPRAPHDLWAMYHHLGIDPHSKRVGIVRCR